MIAGLYGRQSDAEFWQLVANTFPMRHTPEGSQIDLFELAHKYRVRLRIQNLKGCLPDVPL